MASKIYNRWEVALQILTALVVLTVAAVAIVTLVINSNQNSLQRFCGVARDSVVLNSTSPGQALVMVSLKSNERTISWYIQYANLVGMPIEIQIHGPVAVGMTTSTLALALCGVPSTLVCDTSVVGLLKGEIDQTGAGGQPLKPIIQAIRNQPVLYYIQINTDAYPNGEIAMPLTSICGVP